MIRRFNYTGRLKISHDRVPISIVKENNGRYKFSIEFSLSDLNLPSDASVFVEAYKPMKYYKRFDFGSVGDITIPDNTVLENAGHYEDLLFRVKIVNKNKDGGLLVASADKITSSTESKDKSKRQSLLPVITRDIGEAIWRLSLGEEDRPILEVNDKIEGLSEIVRTDSEFHALVFPEIIERILKYSLKSEGVNDPFADDDMWHLWVRFACILPGVPPIPDEDKDIPDWVDCAVKSFCKSNNYIERYRNLLERRNS